MSGKGLQLSGMLGSQQVELVTYFDVSGSYGPAQSLIVFQMPYPVGASDTFAYNGTITKQ